MNRAFPANGRRSRPELSILISSKERLRLFRRALWAIEVRPPCVPFEVVVADDGSKEDILGELRKRSFPWKFVRVDSGALKERGVSPFWNCPALTNNAAFAACEGDLVAQMGNEIIPWGFAFDRLLDDLPDCRYAWAVSTTWDVPQDVLDTLDEEGTNLTRAQVSACAGRVLSNGNNVPNYLSVFTRGVWEELGGYDERYLNGVGKEDSDFMRRAFSLPGFRFARSPALSLHQYHGGVSHLYRPLPSVISEELLAAGVAINRRLYEAWDGTVKNRQGWSPASLGVLEVIVS